jgi:hypothetical protein
MALENATKYKNISLYQNKNIGIFHQSFVSSVIIYDELGRNDHSSILHNCDWEGAETTWCQN